MSYKQTTTKTKKFSYWYCKSRLQRTKGKMRFGVALISLISSLKQSSAFLGNPSFSRDVCSGKVCQLKDLVRDNLLSNTVDETINSENCVESFFRAFNNRDFETVIDQFSMDATFEDASYPSPFQGKGEIDRHFRLLADSSFSPFQLALDEIAVDRNKIAALYHIEDEDGVIRPNSRHITFFTLNEDTGNIQTAYDTVEPVNKAGEVNLKVLSNVNKLLEKSDSEIDDNKGDTISTNKSGRTELNSIPEKFFDAFNRRSPEDAIKVFEKDCLYDDTVFPKPLNGLDELKGHLELCDECLPPTFKFIVDDVADGGNHLGVRWHVENEGEEMPFTRGNSFYTLDSNTGLVKQVIDEIEPAVLKKGGVQNFFGFLTTRIREEPARLVPLVMWAAYMYIVFFSDGILPGANALQLEQRTWEEVRDLSLNFFFVSPLLNLPFAPSVHPILEGVFNLLLSWAALFSGFFSDDRKDKQNMFPMLPAVVGMQFLTSAFLLPYLVLRTSEQLSDGEKITVKDLDPPAKITESNLLAPFLGLVGTGSFIWGAFARASTFGGFNERLASFWDLMSIDRVGSSFLVDLAIFALFQGWLVDDDLKRRGIKSDEMMELRLFSKTVPFFGLVAYMIQRPAFEEEK